jgi:hypothetical protein
MGADRLHSLRSRHGKRAGTRAAPDTERPAPAAAGDAAAEATVAAGLAPRALNEAEKHVFGSRSSAYLRARCACGGAGYAQR